MRVYVVYCHPDRESFTAAVHQRAIDVLHGAGHEVRVSDLYAEGFEPAMSGEEVANHRTPSEANPAVAEYCNHLRWCEVLVFIYPTWWSGQPAMLKGWLDRVLICGVAWDPPVRGTRITPRLTNIHQLVAITGHGSSRLINMLEGQTGRKVIGNAVRALCHRKASMMWLPMYDIDRSTPAQRHAFLDHVERRLAEL